MSRCAWVVGDLSSPSAQRHLRDCCQASGHVRAGGEETRDIARDLRCGVALQVEKLFDLYSII